MPAARYRSIEPDALPASCGTSTVAGATLWTIGSDVYEVIVDDHGTLSVFLLDLDGGHDAVQPAADAVSSALDFAAPLHLVIADLAGVLMEADCKAGAAILRFLPSQGRVEVLNAGLPPIACVQPDGRATLISPRSGPVGLLKDDVHAYDLLPFAWNSQWFVMSDGVTAGSLARAAVTEAVETLRISTPNLAQLASESTSALVRRLSRIVGPDPMDDASLLVVHTDPSKSPASGIR